MAKTKNGFVPLYGNGEIPMRIFDAQNLLFTEGHLVIIPEGEKPFECDYFQPTGGDRYIEALQRFENYGVTDVSRTYVTQKNYIKQLDENGH